MTPKEGDIYSHYKGDEYIVISIATLEATGEKMVVYEATEKPFQEWVRPLPEWHEEIKPGVLRFTLIEERVEES